MAQRRATREHGSTEVAAARLADKRFSILPPNVTFSLNVKMATDQEGGFILFDLNFHFK